MIKGDTKIANIGLSVLWPNCDFLPNMEESETPLEKEMRWM